MERPSFNPDLLSWEDPFLVWATSSGDRLYKEHGRRKLSLCLSLCISLSDCSHSFWQASSLLALDTTALGFWLTLMTS